MMLANFSSDFLMSWKLDICFHKPVDSFYISPQNDKYCQISNISRTTSQNWNLSRLVLQLSLLNPLEAGVKSIMKM